MKKIISLFIVGISFFIFSSGVSATTLQDLYDELSALEKSYNLSQEQKAMTQAEMNRVKANILNTEKEINQAHKDIIEAQKNIEESEIKIEEKKEETNQMLLYLQIMNSTGNSMLEYVFEADDYTDFIYRYSVVTQMSDYNQSIITELNTLISELNAKKESLSVKQRDLSKKKNQLQTQYALIQTQYKEEHADGLDLKDQIAEQKATIKRFENLGCKRSDNINSCNGMMAVDGWVYPLNKFRQSSSYGWDNNRYHYAVDLGVSEGSEVKAVGNGEVLSAGLTSTKKSCYSDYLDEYWNNCHCGGYVIKIVHNYKGTTYISLYMHMLTSKVKAGDKVVAGDVIGTSGGGPTEARKWKDYCTGGPHLHFTMAYGTYIGYSNEKGSTFDPVVFFPAMKGENSYYGY